MLISSSVDIHESSFLPVTGLTAQPLRPKVVDRAMMSKNLFRLFVAGVFLRDFDMYVSDLNG